MPEYLALSHFHNLSSDEGEPEAIDPADMTDMFLRMERAGIAKVH